MKIRIRTRFVPAFVVLVALATVAGRSTSLTTSLTASAQTALPPPAPVPPATVVGPTPNTPTIEQHVETILKDVTRHAGDAVRSTVKSYQSAVNDADLAAFQFGSGARSSSRSLAIVTSGADPEKIDALEEDLSVMARILQKAARSLREEDRLNAMGIFLDTSVFGSASGARNLYVESHGAVFLLSVRYPLIGLRENGEPAPDRPADTEWERTRDEVLGRGRDSEESEVFGVARGSSGKVEVFDERKVDGLKTALIDAIKKNAANIRALAPNEFVTVVVQGGEAVAADVKGMAATGAGGATTAEARTHKESRGARASAGRRNTSKGESVMNIRVRKSDIDAYAAGTLSDGEFQKKAAVLTYLRRNDTARSMPR